MDKIQQDLQLLLHHLINVCYPQEDLLSVDEILINVPKLKKHGDLSSNIALVLAKKIKTNPIGIARNIVSAFNNQHDKDHIVAKVEILEPGFINFFLLENAYIQIVEEILFHKQLFGTSQIGADKKIHIEFVSANPTGPLHVGHGRGAIFGSSLANILQICGYKVTREYYVNDIGRQIDILVLSIYMRYLEGKNLSFSYPIAAYQGNYIKEIAVELFRYSASLSRRAAW